MKALLIVAHGSRRSEANEQVRRLTQNIRNKVFNYYEKVDCAFLEIANPSTQQSIDELVESGVKSIKLLPYFLTIGSHVEEDIPRIIKEKEKDYPDVQIEMMDYIGNHQGIFDIIIAQTTNSKTNE